jgi:hypothetical protein
MTEYLRAELVELLAAQAGHAIAQDVAKVINIGPAVRQSRTSPTNALQDGSFQRSRPTERPLALSCSLTVRTTTGLTL